VTHPLRTPSSPSLVRGPIAIALFLAACPSAHQARDSDGGGRDPDAGPCVPAPVTDDVDLLLMVDDSGGIGEEQASLVQALPHLARVLATGDRDPFSDGDGDGELDDVGDDFEPVSSLRIGVVTSDMGAGGFGVPTCGAEPNFGDDGVLRTEGQTAISGCAATYPAFQELSSGADAARFAADVGCVAWAGTGGCGFDQPLEAALKALTPSTCADPWCSFVMGTRGHADGANAGFLRGDSVLAVVLVTDEEDCSPADPDLFNPESARYAGGLNLRCFLNPTAIHPVSRYVDGFLATRANASRLVYGAIAGVPTNLTSATSSYDEILAAPTMQERIDPTMTTRIAPSCNLAGRGLAFPPRRLVSVAQELERRGAHTFVGSICQAEFTPSIDALIDAIADAREEIGCE
jgi:hypothetical protein